MKRNQSSPNPQSKSTPSLSSRCCLSILFNDVYLLDELRFVTSKLLDLLCFTSLHLDFDFVKFSDIPRHLIVSLHSPLCSIYNY